VCLVLGIDFETTGLNPKVHVICEVGAQLWDTEYHRAVQSLQCLVQPPVAAPPFEPDAIAATGLVPDLITKYGKDSLRSLKQLLNMYDQADVICAHNGNTCDRLFLRAWMDFFGFTDETFLENKLWLDTMVDIDYPKKWNKQLICLAAYHGFINPFPHQAMGDVMTMFAILDHYPIEQVIEMAQTPTIGARLTGIPYDDREWAKTRGYFPYYMSGKFMFWMKTFKENKLEAEAAEAKTSGYGLERLSKIPEGVY